MRYSSRGYSRTSEDPVKIIITQLSATLFEIAVIDSEYGDRINSCTKKTEKEAMEWCRRH